MLNKSNELEIQKNLKIIWMFKKPAKVVKMIFGEICENPLF